MHYNKTHRQPRSCIVKFLQLLCSSCIRLILVYTLVLRKMGRRYKRWSDITIFFPKHSFLFFCYHQMNLVYSFIISKIVVYIFIFFWTNSWISIEKGCHPNCITFMAFLTTYFIEHSRKRYFNDIFWAPAYDNNTLPDTGISSNKI